ncbi:MAG: tyrosine-type recombinase/integrase, partial [Verrucomicrobiales bacterium]
HLVDKNPVDGLKRRRLRRKVVAVYTPEQVEALLNSAWEHDREMVPFFAILIFAGLRPDLDSEIGKLRWEDVNFGAKWIRVGANFDNKTETKRFVPIEDNLMAWLEPWRGSTGTVLPKNIRRRRRYLTRGKYQSPLGSAESEWNELAPFGSHVRDITRHTYGSYLDAKYQDRNRVMANMGHTTFRTYEQHYKNARSPQEAERFWAIVPPNNGL